MKSLSDLASLIHSRRKSLGLSRAAMSRQSGISYWTIVSLEYGRSGLPSPSDLKAIAAALDLPEAALLNAAGFEVLSPEALEGSQLDLAEAVLNEK